MEIRKEKHRNIRPISKWYKEFTESSFFNNLSQEEKFMSKEVITTFAEGVYEWEAQSPYNWDEHGVLCCVDFCSFKVINNPGFFRSLLPVLREFFEFLYQNNYKNNGHVLSEIARKMQS